MRRSQALVVLLLAATFAAGIAGGVAVDRIWLRPTPAAADARDVRDDDRDRRGDRERDDRSDGDDRDDDGTVIERFSEELGLSEAQEARIDTILKHYQESMKDLRREVRPRYAALVDSARRRIEDVLDPAQARKYRELLEHEGKRDDRDEGEEEGDGRREDGAEERR